MVKFILDLDGTVTSVETLPVIAGHFGVQEKIDELTKATIMGNIPFVESFIKRVYILGEFPVSEIASLLEHVPLYPLLHAFLTANQDKCVLATGNLDCWVNKLVQHLGCESYTSSGIVRDDKVIKLTHILKKEDIVAKYQALGYQVIYVGEGNNDMEAMRTADISVAVGLTHQPANSVLTVADYLIYDEVTLCQQLNQLC